MTVRDPYRHTTERVARERKEEDCGAGEHGEGRTLIREATQDFNGRGEAVGDPAHGPWRVSIDLCRADYSQWEHYTLACHWEAGPPHNRRMDGREVWRRLKTVTSEGESLGPPEFVSTSCWTGGTLPPAPVPAVSETGSEESKSGACPAGYTGSLGYRRTVTLRSTRLPPEPSMALEDRGALVQLRGVSAAVRVAEDVAALQRDAVTERLWEERRLEVAWNEPSLRASSPGSFVFLEAIFENGRAAFQELGERGVPGKLVGDRAARRLLAFLETEAAVDEHLADQLAVPLAVAGCGGRVSTPRVTSHLETVVGVLRAFGLEASTWGRLGGPGGLAMEPS